MLQRCDSPPPPSRSFLRKTYDKSLCINGARAHCRRHDEVTLRISVYVHMWRPIISGSATATTATTTTQKAGASFLSNQHNEAIAELYLYLVIWRTPTRCKHARGDVGRVRVLARLLFGFRAVRGRCWSIDICRCLSPRKTRRTRHVYVRVCVGGTAYCGRVGSAARAMNGFIYCARGARARVLPLTSSADLIRTTLAPARELRANARASTITSISECVRAHARFVVTHTHFYIELLMVSSSFGGRRPMFAIFMDGRGFVRTCYRVCHETRTEFKPFPWHTFTTPRIKYICRTHEPCFSSDIFAERSSVRARSYITINKCFTRGRADSRRSRLHAYNPTSQSTPHK